MGEAMTDAGSFRATVGVCSEAGIKPINEDAIGFSVPDDHLLRTKGMVAVVADGVSTAEAGKEAAELCVATILKDYFTTPETWSVKHSIQKLLSPLNNKLYTMGHEIPNESRGYITTLSMMVIKSHFAYLFHIGDSRIYRLSAEDGSFTQLTRDHCASISTEEQNYLIRAMGMDTSLNVDVSTVSLTPGDIFFLSTDGVHDFVGDDDIRAIIEANPEDYDQACRKMVEYSAEAGSTDNISCCLLRVDELGLENIDDLNERLTRLPFPPELRPGLKIDGYLVEKELYASERSQLYIVRNEDNGEELIMKTPSQNYCDDPAYIERFIMEEWIGSRIDHPRVVKVVAPKTERKFLYYLMEKVEGVTLDEWLEQNPERRPKHLIAIVEQIVEGMNGLHEKETVHQDLKPSNIMISPDREATIIDFGSVYAPGIHEIFMPVAREEALGTLDYADPAYQFHINTGIKGDIYSLGVMVYEMFTGALPYGTRLERCSSYEDFLNLNYVPSYHHRDIIPVWFDEALKKAVSIDPAVRYDSLDSFLYDLKTPNVEFLRDDPKQETGRDMLLFWKMLSFMLLGLLIMTWFVMAQS